MILTDTVEWGSTYELDIYLEDLDSSGAVIGPTDLSSFTTLEGVVKLNNEDVAVICNPVLTKPAAGTIRYHLSPAMTKLLPRVGIGSAAPQVVSEVRIKTADGTDAFRPVRLSLIVDVGPLS